MIFCLLLAWILVPPFVTQVLGISRVYLRDWAMMHNAGVGLIDARFFAVESGAWRQLDVRPLLPKVSSRGSGRRGVLWTDAEVLAIASQLCAQSGAGADIRVRSRRGERLGWQTERNGENNLCAP